MIKNSLWLEVTPLWSRAGGHLDGITRTIYEFICKSMAKCLDLRFCRYSGQNCIEIGRAEMKAVLERFCPDPKYLETIFAGAGLETIDQGDAAHRRMPEESPYQPGDVLLIMGLQWDSLPYGKFLRERAHRGYHVVTVINDLIPIRFPEALGEWRLRPESLDLVLRASSVVYTASEHSIWDISAYISERNLPRMPIQRLYWGSDVAIRKIKKRPERFAALQDNRFAMYVSSVTFRKNHEMLFELWRDIYHSHKEYLVPMILVGGLNGDYRGQFMGHVRNSLLYPDYFRLETGVNDDDLQWLYEHCRFTVYPSYYEGWGLPVSESLAYGKPCMISDATSLPEAGAGLADTLKPFDFYAWKDMLLRYLRDDELINSKKAEIRQAYTHVTWENSVERFISSLTATFPELQSGLQHAVWQSGAYIQSTL